MLSVRLSGRSRLAHAVRFLHAETSALQVRATRRDERLSAAVVDVGVYRQLSYMTSDRPGGRPGDRTIDSVADARRIFSQSSNLSIRLTARPPFHPDTRPPPLIY